MADIAILVAEEHERMTKKSAAGKSGGERGEETGLVSCVSVMAKRLDGSSWLKKIGEENMDFVNWVLEPKSQIALAAFNGFFSA